MNKIIFALMVGLTAGCGDAVNVSHPAGGASVATGGVPQAEDTMLTGMLPAVEDASAVVWFRAGLQANPSLWQCTRDAECWGRKCSAGVCVSSEPCTRDQNCVFGSTCSAGTCQDQCERDHLDDAERTTSPFHRTVSLSPGVHARLTICPNDYDVFELMGEMEQALVQVRSEAAHLLRVTADPGRVEHCARAECSSYNTCPDGRPCAWNGVRRNGVTNRTGEISLFLQANELLYIERATELTEVVRYDLEIR